MFCKLTPELERLLRKNILIFNYMDNENEPIKFKIDLEKMTPIIDKIDYYSNIKSTLTPIFGICVIISSALWWYDKPQVASLLSSATIVMGFIVLYSSINVIIYIRKIGKLE